MSQYTLVAHLSWRATHKFPNGRTATVIKYPTDALKMHTYAYCVMHDSGAPEMCETELQANYCLRDIAEMPELEA